MTEATARAALRVFVAGGEIQRWIGEQPWADGGRRIGRAPAGGQVPPQATEKPARGVSFRSASSPLPETIRKPPTMSYAAGKGASPAGCPTATGGLGHPGVPWTRSIRA